MSPAARSMVSLLFNPAPRSAPDAGYTLIAFAAALLITVHVAPDDMGRVIGKRGRVANAIRTVVRAAAVRDDVEVEVEFGDD